jgi:hypothetical protein
MRLDLSPGLLAPVSTKVTYRHDMAIENCPPEGGDAFVVEIKAARHALRHPDFDDIRDLSQLPARFCVDDREDFRDRAAASLSQFGRGRFSE